MPESIDLTLASLLRKSQQGDERALNLLCRELEGILRGFFWKKFRDREIVNDLAQESYLRLLQSLPKIKKAITLRSFVSQIAVGVYFDFLRQKYHSQEVTLTTDSNSEADTILFRKAEDVDSDFEEEIIKDLELQHALKKLPEKSRQILLMKVDGFKYEEIAGEVGLSVSGVKMQIQRSLEFLRSSLFHVTFWPFFTTLLIKGPGKVI